MSAFLRQKVNSVKPSPLRQKAMSSFLLFFVAAAVFYVFFVGVVWVLQPRLIYFPIGKIDLTPRVYGLDHEDLTLLTSDGEKIRAWFIPAKSPRGTLLFCHGNAGNISHRLDSLKLFYDLGLDVLIFDYRGYGESTGSPTEEGTYRDAETAWDFLVNEKEVSPERIVVFGRSLGGAVAACLAKEKEPGALIVESVFSSVGDIGSEVYPFLPVRLISRFKYNTRAYVQKISCPILVVHSPEDDIIPYHHGRRVFEAAKDPKEFLKLQGSHNEGFLISGKNYRDGLDRFLSTYLAE